jgi:aryl-alcohol dehydrogenase-like predicted oxidoreductase
MTLPTRTLGQGLQVGAVGLGCMGMSDFYGPHDDAQSLAVLDRAVELGVTLVDTSDMYGSGTNERLLGGWLPRVRDRVVLATKFGIVRDPKDPTKRALDSSPKYVRSACEASLQRLGIETIDLYYQHRVDPATPIEDTVGAMKRLVEEGKVRFLGLSEAGAETMRRACAVHPIAALQSEYSLWTRDPEDGTLATCRELGIGFVAYSPLGRGFLAGEIRRFEDLAPDDFRRMSPRFQGENFRKNLELVERIQLLAAKKETTPAVLALAWVLARGDDIVPIPGTKRQRYLEQNARARDLRLTRDELAEIDAVAPKGVAAGERYAAAFMTTIGR